MKVLIALFLVLYLFGSSSTQELTKDELFKRGLAFLKNCTSGYNGSFLQIDEPQPINLQEKKGLLDIVYHFLGVFDTENYDEFYEETEDQSLLDHLNAVYDDDDSEESDSVLYSAVFRLAPSIFTRIKRFFGINSAVTVVQQPDYLLDTPNEWRQRLPTLLTTRPPLSAAELVKILPALDDVLVPEDRIRQNLVLYYAILGLQGHHRSSVVLLADMHLFGSFDMRINVTIARHFYKLAAEHLGCTKHSQYMLGFLYASGLGGSRDQARANLYLSAAASSGDPRAVQAMGYRHSAGIGTPAVCENALPYYKKIAQRCIYDFLDGPPLGRRLKLRKISLPELTDGGIYGPTVSPSDHLTQDAAEVGVGGGNAHTYKRRRSRQSVHSEKDLMLYYEAAADKDLLARFALGYIYYKEAEHRPEYYKLAQMHFFLAASHVTGAAPGNAMLPGDQTPSVFDTPLQGKSGQSTGLQFATVSSSRMQACVQAMGFLGQMAWRGEGQKPDPAAARLWFEKAAYFSDGSSMNALGVMLKSVDLTKATQLFLRASETDHSDAHTNLGLLYFENNDYTNAAKFFSLGVRHGHPIAYYWYGRMLEEGLGMQQHCRLALHYYKLLSEKNDWFDDPHNDAIDSFVDERVDYGFLKFAMAAERGYEVSQTTLAWLLDQGLYAIEQSPLYADSVSPSSLNEAVLHWHRAAIQGKIDAKVKVGDYWYYGIGTHMFDTLINVSSSKIEGTAATLFEELSQEKRLGAGADGLQQGARVSGRNGCAKDLFSVHDIWERVLRYTGLLPPDTGLCDARKAASFYLEAADYGHSSLAQWNVGYMYEYGIGLKQDYYLAKRYYDMALESNSAAYLATQLSLFRLSVKSTLSALPFPTSLLNRWYEGSVAKTVQRNTSRLALSSSDSTEFVLILLFCAAAGLLIYARNRLRRVLVIPSTPPQHLNQPPIANQMSHQANSSTSLPQTASTSTPPTIPRRRSSISFGSVQGNELKESLQRLSSSASSNSISDNEQEI